MVDLKDTKKTGVDTVIAHIEKKKVIAPKLDGRVRNVPENDKPLREMEKRRMVGPDGLQVTRVINRRF